MAGTRERSTDQWAMAGVLTDIRLDLLWILVGKGCEVAVQSVADVILRRGDYSWR